MECDNDASSCMHACIRIYIRGERDNAVIFLEFSILGRDIKSNITMKEIREGIDRSIVVSIAGQFFPKYAAPRHQGIMTLRFCIVERT